MRLIDADELIERAKELYNEMDWEERETHFSLLDLEANVFSMQKPREVKEMEMKIADLEAHNLYLEKKNSAYILLSFDNCQALCIGQYRENEKGGAFYDGDQEDPLIKLGLVVNAWMPLPERYKEKEA